MERTIMQIARSPGVYALVRSKSVLYVGCAGSLRKRLRNKRHLVYQKGQNGDVFRIWKFPEEAYEGLIELLESYLIKQLKPQFNKNLPFRNIEQLPLALVEALPRVETLKFEEVYEGLKSSRRGRQPRTDVFAQF